MFFLLLAFATSLQSQFLKGADISFIKEIEDFGGVFKQNGQPLDLFKILKSHNMNCIRLRIWHTPLAGYSNLANTLLLAQRAKQNGLKILLDFHYSDWWADPGNQTKPVAWKNISFNALNDSVYSYTKSVLSAMKAQNTTPEYVQIGNEITQGMLWNDGKVGGSFDTDSQWVKLSSLIISASRAINEISNDGFIIKKIIHLDRGGDYSSCKWFFDNLIWHGVDFDIIGLSYYPWWHGTMTAMGSNVNMLVNRYQKPVAIVETAYPWTLQWKDNCNNFVGTESQLLYGYAASIAGQKQFLIDLMQTVINNGGDKALGVFYWEPDYIAIPGLCSPYENLAMFDFDNNALDSFSAFDDPSGINEMKHISTNINAINIKCFPNPSAEFTTFEISSVSSGEGNFSLKDILGREIYATNFYLVESKSYTIKLNLAELCLSSGIFIATISINGNRSSVKIVHIK